MDIFKIPEVEVPLCGTIKISDRVRFLYLCFISNDLVKALRLIESYLQDKNTLHKDLKTFNYLCYIYSYEKYKLFFTSLFLLRKDLNTTSLIQICTHRIYEREGYVPEIPRLLKYSIESANDLGSHKWRISGYFFHGMYSGDKNKKFKCFTKCLDLDKIEIDMDLWRDKMVYMINWLRYYYPEESREKIEAIYKYLRNKGETYRKEILPLVKITEFDKMDESVFNSFTSSEILQFCDSIKNKHGMKNKIAIFGSTGLVGSSIIRNLNPEKYGIYAPTRKELDLMDREKVLDWFFENRVDYVIIAAAKVGGIVANSTYPTEFLYDNLTIQNNIIMSAFQSDVENLIFLGSSCIYPRECPQPIKEEYLLTGPLEITNKSYALAKIAGIQLCDSIRKQYGKNYYSLMPCNLYGPGDNFNIEASHVIPGIIRKIENAINNNQDQVNLLGTGKPLREFLYVDDLAQAIIFMIENYNGNDGLINVGSGSEISIKELAEIIASCMNYSGEIVFDTDAMDGTPRKIMDNSKISSLGWKPKVNLESGIIETLKWYNENKDKIRK